MDKKSKSKQGKAIKLRQATLQRLDKLKHKGQTYDGIVSELIESVEERRQMDNKG